MDPTSYDVRIWTTEIYKGKQTTTYWVRWIVGGKRRKEAFKSSGLADSFRSKLVTAARVGEAFYLSTGLPLSMTQRVSDVSWYEFACSYVDMKWPDSAGKSRKGIAETLATITPLLLAKATSGRPSPKIMREALNKWSFNMRTRKASPPPPHLRAAVDWISANTLPVSALESTDTLRAVLNAISRKLDGTPAAASTASRKRAVLYNALEFAVEKGALTQNQLARLHLPARKVVEEIDRRVVVNPQQAVQLLDAVRLQGRTGRQLVAFFALIYYAALRPGEAADLRASALTLPPSGWGELFLPGSAPTTGAEWSDNGRRRDARGLKHRPVKATRPVPCPPQLTAILHRHLDEFGTNSSGRLFHASRDPEGDLSDSVYTRVWGIARRSVLTPEEAASPLARRPYDLRHAAVSTWLNAGVPATQVAEWAGHSLTVLLKVYAKCLAGQEGAARDRVTAALQPPAERPAPAPQRGVDRPRRRMATGGTPPRRSTRTTPSASARTRHRSP